MKDTRRLGWALAGLLLVTTITGCSSAGQHRFFGNQAHHFQTLRELNDASADGAEAGEVLQTIRQIKEGVGQSWYSAWDATGRRILDSARHTQDPTSRGHAFLRAHNYSRTAEFFLPPNDPRRLASFHANVAAFENGLDALGIQRERLKVPYGQGELQAIYYPGLPGAERKPLLVFCGGIDSTLEELYFVLVRAAHDRGFAVLAYEGPARRRNSGKLVRRRFSAARSRPRPHPGYCRMRRRLRHCATNIHRRRRRNVERKLGLGNIGASVRPPLVSGRMLLGSKSRAWSTRIGSRAALLQFDPAAVDLPVRQSLPWS